MSLRPERIRADFPIFNQKKVPIYFDNACMTLRPQQVIDAVTQYYAEFPACGGRSTHHLSRKVDEHIFDARKKISKFIGAKKENEVVMLRNTTEAINLVARSFPFAKDNHIVIGSKEHNSNLIPWQKVAKEKGLTIHRVPLLEDNSFDMESYKHILEHNKEKISLVALGHTANLDGMSIHAKDVIKHAHANGARVLLDAAQSVPHQELDVRKLGADFVCFSGHKMMGPSGTGVLYAPRENLMELRPDNVGGETVMDATYDKAEFDDIPYRFEAGLQHYAGIIGLGAAAKYLQKIGLHNIYKHEIKLNTQLSEGLLDSGKVDIIGNHTASARGGICSFNVKGVHHHDVASLLDAAKRIAIRSGRHCVHSWFNEKGLDGSARASLYGYNTQEEVQTFLEEMKSVLKLSK